MLVDQGPLWETGGSTSHAPGLVFQHNPSRDDDAVRAGDGRRCSASSCGCFHARRRDRGRRHARSAGTSCTGATAARSPSACRAALLDARAGRGARPADRPGADPRRPAHPDDGIAKALRAAEAMAAPRRRRCSAFGDCEVTGFDVERGARPRRRTPRCGTIRTDDGRARRRHLGPEGRRGSPASGSRSSRSSTSTRSPRRCPSWPARRARSSTRSCATRTARLYFRQHRRRLRDRQLPPRAAAGRAARRSAPPGGADAAVDAAVHAGGLRRAPRAETGAAAARASAARRCARTLQRPDVVHARRHAADRRGRPPPAGLWLCEAIWVTHAGGAGRALAELIVARRRPHRPARVRPAALRRRTGSSRALRARRAAHSSTARSTTSSTRASSSEQVAALRRTPFYAAPARARRGLLRERRLGAPAVVRGQRGARSPDDVPPRRAWPARDWSPIAAAEHRACRERVGPVRPHAVHQGRGPRPGRARPTSSAWPPTTSTGRSGTIVYTAMLRAARRDHVRPHDHAHSAEDASSSSPAARSAGTTSRGCAATCRGTARSSSRTRPRGCAASASGARGRATSSRRVADDDVSNEAFPYMTARELHVGPVPVRALRISYVGELGWEIYAPTEFGARAVGPAVAGGRAARRGRRAAARAYDSLRLEKGYRLWGADIDEEHDPYEAGLGWAVQARQGRLHRPRDARRGVKEAGVARRLRCLVARRPARRAGRQGADPRRRRGGRLRHERRARRDASARASPTATCRSSAPRSGPRSSVYAEGERHAATVASEPLFDPRNERVRDVAPAAVAG